MAQPSDASGLDLVALVGATEAEVPVLAELHRNPRVHVVGVYDSRPEAVGHELSEILGLRHGHDRAFLEHIASASQVVLPRHRRRFQEEIAFLRERGCRVLNLDEALLLWAHPRRVERAPETPLRPATREGLEHLENSLRWLEQALDRESLLRSLLSIAVQAVGADRGSVQLFDPFSQQLFIAYADGLSDHTVRNTRQCLGEGIAGRVAASRRAELIQGQDAIDPERDRPDIQSAVCVPLLESERLLGVLNVSTDLGSRRLSAEDLTLLQRMATRIAPVLARLLEIQSTLDRSLVEDLQRELDRLHALDAPSLESLALLRDLVLDLSGAEQADLVLLLPDGPGLHLRPGRDERGRPRYTRDVDATHGILAQVLIDGSPVVLEEKTRRAGEREVRRQLTLYVPLGGRDAFAVLMLRFRALGALAHFQRNVERLRDILTPRLASLLARHDTRTRDEQLRRLAAGLAELAAQSPMDRAVGAATLLLEISEATAVAIWTEGGAPPRAEVHRNTTSTSDELWARLRERIGAEGSCRVREMDDEASSLRSLLLVGDPDGIAVAALNRESSDPLAERGFREEDVEAAALIAEALRAPEGEGPELPTSLTATEDLPPGPTPMDILSEAVEREMRRAQRYHFGFSVSVFAVEGSADPALARTLRETLAQAVRGTDTALWIDDFRLAVLAPEEARGQRRLVRRLQSVLQETIELFEPTPTLRASSVAYPRDGDQVEVLLDALDLSDPRAGN